MYVPVELKSYCVHCREPSQDHLEGLPTVYFDKVYGLLSEGPYIEIKKDATNSHLTKKLLRALLC